MTAIDLTPGWNGVRDKFPAAHTELERLAARIFDAERDAVADERGHAHAYSAAIPLDLVKVTAEGVSFADPSMRDDYVARHACTAATAEWSRPEAFAQALADVQYRASHFGSAGPVAMRVVGILASAGVPILSHIRALATLPESQRHLFWSVYSELCEVLPALDATADELVEAIVPVLNASAGDMASGAIYAAVAGWAARSQARAEELIRCLRERNHPALLPAALSALARFDRAGTHKLATDLLGVEDNPVRSAALLALGSLSYSPEGDDLLADTLTRFDSLLADSVVALDPALVQAYFSLGNSGVNVGEFLQRLSTRDDAQARHAMAAGLFYCEKTCVGEPWWRKSLQNLASTPTTSAGTYRYLDYAASALAKVDATAALAFVECVALAGSAVTQAQDIHDLLSGTMAELHRNAVAQMEEAITDWFASSERLLNELAAGVVDAHVGRRYDDGAPLALSKARLHGRSADDIVNLLQRIAGWVHGGAERAALITSSLRAPNPDARVAAFVSELLKVVVLYNYPASAGDFLRLRLDSGSVPTAEAESIAAALSASDAYYDSLRALPELPELRTPAHREYLRRLELTQMHARIIEEAQKTSVMLSLVHHVPLKYGRTFFSDRDGRLSDPAPLKSFSHEMEVPRGETIDPLGQLVMRINLRSAAALGSADTEGNNA